MDHLNTTFFKIPDFKKFDTPYWRCFKIKQRCFKDLLVANSSLSRFNFMEYIIHNFRIS